MTIETSTRKLGTRVPSWYDVDADVPVAFWGYTDFKSPAPVEACVFVTDERVWVESWNVGVGIVTFWEADTFDAAIQLADFLAVGAL